MKTERISINPKILGGKPCIAGTRIAVTTILELLEDGLSFDEIVNDYYPHHKCKLKDRSCHSEAVFCRRICDAKRKILRIQPLRMTLPLLKFTLMLPAYFYGGYTRLPGIC